MTKITIQTPKKKHKLQIIILNEVEGVGTDLQGQPLSLFRANSIVMANPQLHEELVYHHFPQNKEIIELIQQRLTGHK